MTSIIGDRYEQGDIIGRGGMGTVYHGVDRETGATVAIKHLHPDRADGEQIARFQREGAALRELNHPNIAKMLTAIQESGQYYLVMEYVTGGDLKQLIQEQPLASDEVVRMGIDLADALTRAHKLGIVHRDLKPANVLIADDGTLRLTDFGIAHVRHQETISKDDAIMGTIDYMAPEMLGGEDITEHVDIWAFGIMLFEMLTGHNPFSRETVMQTISAISFERAPDITQYNATVSAELQDLIYRMLEHDVHSRISSVRYVGAILEDIQQGRTTNSNYKTRFETDTQDFTALKRNNLPEQLTEFVGRETEIAEVQRLLDTPSARLITVLAPGGMGKTRLALEVARRNLTHYDDGVYFVELAPITKSEKIISAIADAFDFQIQGGDPTQQVVQFLSDKTLLLVIDNWEHVIDGASIVTDILKDAPNVKIINTSRVRLGQMGETLFHLSGMDFPRWETPEDAMEYAAVKLFLNSARRAQPSFELTTDNLDYVARICRLVQGMPLGILLSAAWVSMLAPHEIAEELQSGMDLLVDESGELPERQQSIHLVMDYSWQAMTEAEQAVFAKLTLFQGGFTREAAQEIAGANLRTLMSLTNKSLIRRDNDSGRYQIHELLRQFGQEQFEGATDADATRDAYVDYFATFVTDRESNFRGSLRQLAVVAEFTQEIENIQQAWFYANQQRDTATQQSMIVAMHHYFFDFNHYYDGVSFYEKALAEFSAPSTDARKHLLYWLRTVLAEAYAAIGKIAEGMALIEDALDYARSQSEDTLLQFQAHKTFGRLNTAQGKVDFAFDLMGTIFVIAEKLDDPWYTLDTHKGKAFLLSLKGVNYQAEMLENLKRAIEIATEIQDTTSKEGLESNIDAITIAMGNWDDAETLVRELLPRTKNPYGIAFQTYKLGRIHYFKGEFEAAMQLAHQAIDMGKEIRSYAVQTVATLLLGFIEIARGDYPQAEQHGQQALDYAKKTEGWLYRMMAHATMNRSQFYLTESAERAEILKGLAAELNNYQLSMRLETVILIAHLKLREGDPQRATELLAIVLEHPKCPPVLKEHYAPINSLRERLQTELSPADFDAAWQGGAAQDFEAVVNQLKEAYRQAND